MNPVHGDWIANLNVEDLGISHRERMRCGEMGAREAGMGSVTIGRDADRLKGMGADRTVEGICRVEWGFVRWGEECCFVERTADEVAMEEGVVESGKAAVGVGSDQTDP